ncbi:MAG: two component system regulatory protein [Acidobacteria bacterium]|nr:two component system regulatory protein [Acidobacteriota bacterium]
MTRPRILVVDDDVPILTLMRNLLREFGFEAVVAGTGAQALAAAREQPPDLVLLDINMPEMSGDEVIRALRRDHGAEQMPILILSGEPMAPTEVAALGANAAVQKPFDVPELIQQIRGYLGQTAAK